MTQLEEELANGEIDAMQLPILSSSELAIVLVMICPIVSSTH